MVRALSLKEVSTLCSGMQYAQGFRHVRSGDVLTPWVGNQIIGGQIRNPVNAQTVRIRFDHNGVPMPACSCNRHPRQRFCPHVAALLIAWATNPDSFSRYQGPDTAPLVEGAPTPREEDPLVAFRVSLDKVEALLADLYTHGLVTLNAGRVRFIREIEGLARAYGLGRVALALSDLNAQISRLNAGNGSRRRTQHEFDEAKYVQALNTAWHLAQVARRALDDGDLTRLREIATLDLADEPATVLDATELVEMAYHEGPHPMANTRTSYLLALDSGRLLAERLPPPRPRRLSLPGQYATSEWGRRHVVHGRVAIYPASDVDEAVLLDVEEIGPPDAEVWRRAYAWAETSAEALVAHLREVVGDMPGADGVHGWFAPARVLVHAGGIGFVDDADLCLDVEPAQAIGSILLDAPILAAFGRLGHAEGRLRFTALSLLTGGDVPDMVALGG